MLDLNTQRPDESITTARVIPIEKEGTTPTPYRDNIPAPQALPYIHFFFLEIESRGLRDTGQSGRGWRTRKWRCFACASRIAFVLDVAELGEVRRSAERMQSWLSAMFRELLLSWCCCIWQRSSGLRRPSSIGFPRVQFFSATLFYCFFQHHQHHQTHQ